jgi:hypothetical protein
MICISTKSREERSGTGGLMNLKSSNTSTNTIKDTLVS